MMGLSLRYIIVAAQYSETAGGVSATYILAQKLNKLGLDVKIWPHEMPLTTFDLLFWLRVFRRLLTFRWRKVYIGLTWFRRTAPPFGLSYAKRADLIDFVAVYTETINGNPLRAKNVARWLLFTPGSFSKKKYIYGKNELFFHFDESFLTNKIPKTSSKLSLALMHSHYYKDNKQPERSGSVYFIRKGRRRADILIPKGGVVLDDYSHSEIASHFNRAQYVVSYDLHTVYLYYASICGCIPVVIPKPGLSRDDWLKKTNQHFGVAYGFEDLEWAISSREKLLNKLNTDYDLENVEIINFIEKIQKHCSEVNDQNHPI
jgi:hypothetical protein